MSTAASIELYRELISDHAKSPRNFHEMPDATVHASAENPTCGDRVTLWLKIDNDTITESSFQGTGCSICISSASMLTQAIPNKSIHEAHQLFEQFHQMLLTPIDQQIEEANLGKLACFAGVRKYPIRIKCATLPWHTMQNLISPRIQKPPTNN